MDVRLKDAKFRLREEMENQDLLQPKVVDLTPKAKIMQLAEQGMTLVVPADPQGDPGPAQQELAPVSLDHPPDQAPDPDPDPDPVQDPGHGVSVGQDSTLLLLLLPTTTTTSDKLQVATTPPPGPPPPPPPTLKPWSLLPPRRSQSVSDTDYRFIFELGGELANIGVGEGEGDSLVVQEESEEEEGLNFLMTGRRRDDYQALSSRQHSIIVYNFHKFQPLHYWLGQ